MDSAGAQQLSPWKDGSLQGRLLRALLAHSEEYLYVKDTEGRYRMASSSLARVLGLDGPDDLVGKHDRDLLPPEFAAQVVANDQAILQAGEPLVDDEQSGVFGGHEYWNTTTKLPVRDDEGEIVGIVGLSRDMTNRIVAERALWEQTHRLHAIINAQRDVATAELDLDSVMNLLCARTMELTGAEGAAVALLDDGELRIGASHGSPEHVVGEALDLNNSLGGQAIRDRRSLICHDALTDRRVNAARVAATGVRSIIAVPLLHSGQPVGSLLVLAQSPQAFGDDDVRTLELFSVVISAAMSHASEFQAKREQVEALMRFRTIFEGASVGIVRIGADGRTLEVNEAVQQMLGYSAEEHARGGIEACTHPDDLPQSIELLRELMDGERGAYEHDKRYVRKDGEVIWAHVRGWLEPRGDGEPCTAIAMIENINERKLAELALRDHSERLARVVETQRDIAAAGVDLESVMQLIVERSQALTVADGAFVSLIDGEELVVGAASGTASALVGERRSLSESVARYAFESGGPLLIEDARDDPRLYREFADAHGEQSHLCVPLFHGERRVAALNVMTTSDGPRLDHEDRRTLELLAVVLASAVSRADEFDAKRRQVDALARFEATYAGALAGIMTLDLEGAIVDANPALQELMGYSAGEVAGTRAESYVHPEDRDEVIVQYRRMVRGEQGAGPFEHRIVRKDGELRWVVSSVSFTRDADGQPNLAVLMVQDVTQRKAAEEALLAQSELNEHQALHDALTGLPNRTLFTTASSRRLLAASREARAASR